MNTNSFQANELISKFSKLSRFLIRMSIVYKLWKSPPPQVENVNDTVTSRFFCLERPSGFSGFHCSKKKTLHHRQYLPFFSSRSFNLFVQYKSQDIQTSDLKFLCIHKAELSRQKIFVKFQVSELNPFKKFNAVFNSHKHSFYLVKPSLAHSDHTFPVA